MVGGKGGAGGERTDKDLANGAARRKAKDILPDSWIPRHEIQRGTHLPRATSDIHTKPLPHAGGDEIRVEQEVRARDDRAHDVIGDHHLRPRVGAEGREDVVLGAVRQAVEQEVDAEQEEPPGRVRPVVGGAFAAAVLLPAARVQRKDGHAGGDGRDDEVLVQGVPLPKHRDMQKHDREQLAALGEEECDVVNVREGGVAEGAGEAAGDGDEGEGREDARRGDDGRDGAAARGGGDEVDASDRRGEDGLDGVEEDGEVPHFGRGRRAVRCCRELLLEVCPCQAGEAGARWVSLIPSSAQGQRRAL